MMLSRDLMEEEVKRLFLLFDSPTDPVRECLKPKQRERSVQVKAQSLLWKEEERTLQLIIHPELVYSCHSDNLRQEDQHLLLGCSVEVFVYFPESVEQPPFCYCNADQMCIVVERINRSLEPLARSSLFHAVSTILSIAKQEIHSVWPQSLEYTSKFMGSLNSYISNAPTSADLLISLLSMAKLSNRTVSLPLPQCFYKDAQVDGSALQKALWHVPPVDSLLEKPETITSLPLKSCVLLNHVLFRSRVRLIEKRVEETILPTESWYEKLLKTSTERPKFIFEVEQPEDPHFLELAKNHGSIFGFHGSPPENFYSILSFGLRNLSGTKAMKNGAAFGEGIYLAADIKVARNFCTWGPKVWNSSSFGVSSSSGGMQFGHQVVAVCEMISLPQYQKLIDAKEHSAYYVIESEKHVRVRALLLFQDPMHSPKQPNQISQNSPARKVTKTARPSVNPFSGLQIAFLFMKLSTVLTLCLMILWMCKGRNAVYSQ